MLATINQFPKSLYHRQSRLSGGMMCRVSVHSFITGLVNTTFWKQVNWFSCILAHVVYGARRRTDQLLGEEVKAQGHTTSNVDLEAWWRHVLTLQVSRFLVHSAVNVFLKLLCWNSPAVMSPVVLTCYTCSLFILCSRRCCHILRMKLWCCQKRACLFVTSKKIVNLINGFCLMEKSKKTFRWFCCWF